MSEPLATAQTRDWILKIVIGCNFCPFAERVVKQEQIAFIESAATQEDTALTDLIKACQDLDRRPEVETSLLIFTSGFSDFLAYLDLLDLANQLLATQGYEGVYQLASFHPSYQFADTEPEAASNYTNRSPFPMLHLLREDSVAKVLAHFPQPETIPANNVLMAEKLGAAFFQKLLRP